MASLRGPKGFERSLLQFALHQIIEAREGGLSAHLHPDGCAVLIATHVLPKHIWVSVFYDLTSDDTPCVVTKVAEGFTHLWPTIFARAMVCALLDYRGNPKIAISKSYLDVEIAAHFGDEDVDLPSITEVRSAIKPRKFGCGNANKFADVVARGQQH